MNAADLLDRLVNLEESERIEAKRAESIGTSILETICAFANEPHLGGGHVLLGVAREELALFPTYEVVGLMRPEKLSADLATQCRTAFNVPLRVDIQQETLDGKTVIVVAVPEAQPGDKPIHFKNQGLPRGAFRRIGSTDQRCTEDDMPVFYQGRDIESFDYKAVPDAGMEDLSPEALAEYRQTLAALDPPPESAQWSDSDLLRAIGCVRIVDGEPRPTVAGVILFGTQLALRRLFPMMRVDYIRVPGKEWVPDPERRFDTTEMRDSMFRLVRRAQAAVLDDLPKAFHLPEGQLQREDRPIIPQKVIREAIVNALMHRNYRVHGAAQIIRYSNRLEIRNPGFSLKPTEHLGEPGSQTRNPKIAAVLHETRFAETKGSGIRVMRQAMEGAGLTAPTFESDRGRDEFTARYLFHHFLGPDDVAWLSRFKSLELTNEEARALIFVRETGAIDNQHYRELTHVDTLKASVSMRRLRDAGLLEQKGKGSATYYVPTAHLTGEARQSLPSKPEGLSSKLEGLSSKPEALSSNPLWAELPADLQSLLLNLGQRAATEEIESAILKLCQHRPMKADELGSLLLRNPDYLATQYLRPLLRRGRLAYVIPDQPNHPQQAYRAVAESGA